MPLEKFTAQWVERVKPPASGRDEWWDKKGTGLGLRVSFTGTKTWCVRYRKDGKRRRMVIGEFPAVTFADANQRAAAILLDVARGGDPAIGVAAAKAAPTVEALAGDYLDRHARLNLRERSWKQAEHILTANVLPAWRTRKAAEIKRRDVIDLLDRIVNRGAPVMANRTLAVVRAMFNWAITRDLVEANPCYLVKPPASESPRDRVLDQEEIRAVWAALAGERLVIAGFFQLCLLTAQRGGEVRQMRWVDVDLDGGWWTIPAELAKNGLSHRVPLSAPAVDLLKDLQAVSGSEWVFPSPRKATEPINNLHHAAGRIREASGVAFVVHDLRRTVASHLASMGVPKDTVSKVLNHADQDVTNRHYIRHSYDQEKREALDTWAERLMAVVG